MESLYHYGWRVKSHEATIWTPDNEEVPMVYADWAASGLLDTDIEYTSTNVFGRYMANTHTKSNASGGAMTEAYDIARDIIKNRVGANDQDALIPAGSGMTSAVVALQDLLDWRLSERYQKRLNLKESERPVVFVSEMEHHSNQTTWGETIAEVVIVPSSETEPIDLEAFEGLLQKYSSREVKVAAVTAASNVTGVRPPIHDVAKLIHRYNGLCFIDCTCAAPYDPINMHPADPSEALDAIYFSPHKFLGGPGAPGILVFNKALDNRHIPIRPGGGTVDYTDPWGGRKFISDIETRNDGGTPPIRGLIQASLAMLRKEEIGLDKIAESEKQMVKQVFTDLDGAEGVTLLDRKRTERLAVFSFTIRDVHYNLTTALLNDRYGIQARAGCACAGTYGHCLLDISQSQSRQITHRIDQGDLSAKLGFTRISMHPIMSYLLPQITTAIKEIAAYGQGWGRKYDYNPRTNEFTHQNYQGKQIPMLGRTPVREALRIHRAT